MLFFAADKKECLREQIVKAFVLAILVDKQEGRF